MPDQVEHDVAGQRTVPRLGAALGVDLVLCGGELAEQVEGFKAGDELALEERLAQGSIEHKVVAVEFGTSIAATAVQIGMRSTSRRRLTQRLASVR